MTEFEYQCKVNGEFVKFKRDWNNVRFLAWIVNCSAWNPVSKDINDFMLSEGEGTLKLTEEEMLAIAEKHINYSINNQNGN